MSANYSAVSPYFLTGYSQFFLDVMVNRPIPKSSDDLLFTINTTYQYRPDLLAFDLYGDSQLWWVFYQRNANSLTAPPMDFEAGVAIYLPKLDTLKTVLGF
jgi:alpha-L-fucosidase